MDGAEAPAADRWMYMMGWKEQRTEGLERREDDGQHPGGWWDKQRWGI